MQWNAQVYSLPRSKSGFVNEEFEGKVNLADCDYIWHISEKWCSTHERDVPWITRFAEVRREKYRIIIKAEADNEGISRD